MKPAHLIQTALVTGGAGFMGSTFIRTLLAARPQVRVISYDRAHHPPAPGAPAPEAADERCLSIEADVCDGARLGEVLRLHGVDTVFHFAKETQVDRSIARPRPFVHSNTLGMFAVLEASRAASVRRLIQVSSDEVYGSLTPYGSFPESSPLRPGNPFAASLASADHLCRAWHRTYGIPVVITRGCNTYGPGQAPEQFLPTMILRASAGKPLPLYGDGMNSRDWIHVQDHCEAILAAAERGRAGEVYNVAGQNPWINIELARLVLKLLNQPESLIELVRDRPGHDKRYALDPAKTQRELGWVPRVDFITGLHETILWYRENADWLDRVLTAGGLHCAAGESPAPSP